MMHLLLWLLLLSEPSPTPTPTPTPPASIGQATMRADGAIILDLRATAPGIHGDGRLVYPRAHPRYQEILKHLGGLKPGQSKPVPPWD